MMMSKWPVSGGAMREATMDEAPELDYIYHEKNETFLFGKHYIWVQVPQTGQWRLIRLFDDFNILDN